jgi:hypothetical protein
MLNKGSNLPATDFILRYIHKNRLRRDENGNVIGILGQAFELRDNEEHLSVCWLDYFNGSNQNKTYLSIVVKNMVLKINPKDAFAIANIEQVKQVADKNDNQVRIVYDPNIDIPNHSEIRKYPRGVAVLYDALAREAFTQVVINSSIKLPL